MSRIGVMQVTDTLAAGGLERVAVNVANHLPREQYDSHLCVTREAGPLVDLISSQVKYFNLARTGRLDVRAVHRLVAYVRKHEIRILHAHGTSLFIAALVSRFKPYPAVVWHDHFGRSATEQRPAWIYGLAAKTVGGVITVNQALAEWAQKKLRIRADRVWCLPNFVNEPEVQGNPPKLPGQSGWRIVCVANLRPEKDHLNLVSAMQRIVQEFPVIHLLLLGQADDKMHFKRIQQAIAHNGLDSHISWLGSRKDVAAILPACDVGVLSSASEGSPLALIEYGLAGLPVVATNVGQCAEVLDEGRAGLLVPAGQPALLAEAILSLLRNQARRVELAEIFQARARQNYSAERIMKRIGHVYDVVLHDQGRARGL